MSKIKEALAEDREFAEKEFFETSESKYEFKDGKGEHLHTYDNQPLIGTSSVSNVLSKPLTWWASGLAMAVFGWIHKGDAKKGWVKKDERLKAAEVMREKIEYMSTDDYLDLLDEGYAAHSKTLKTSAKKGTDLHKECENFVRDFMNGYRVPSNYWTLPDHVSLKYDARIKPLIYWTMKNVKRFLWSEGHCFSTRMWTGGISDCGYEKNDGTIGVMDFKSSKEAYLSQFWQCAGYDIQISENGVFDNKGRKIYTLEKPITEYAIFPFGMPTPVPQFNVDIKGGREAFEAEVLLYKKLN